MLSRAKTRSMAKRNECNPLTRHGEFLKKNKEMCSETERGSYNYCTDHV